MQLNEKDIELIEQWLADESFVEWAKKSDHTTSHWNRHFEAHPEQKELLEVAKLLLLKSPFQPIPERKEQSEMALQQFWTSVEKRKRLRQYAKPKRLINRRALLSWAAVFALLITAGFAWTMWNQRTIEIASDYAERNSFYLPDSTFVVLNANSKISYQHHQSRKIQLEGEAYFEVRKHEDETFEVETKGLIVKVLGTIFNISQRQDKTAVFLKEGKVELSMDLNKDTTLVMQPGELISYSEEKQSFEKIEAKEEVQVMSWKDGTIQFKDESLAYIAQQMHYIYGVQIYLSDEKMKTRTLTVALPNDNLSVAIQTLQNVLGEKVERVEAKSYLIRRSASEN